MADFVIRLMRRTDDKVPKLERIFVAGFPIHHATACPIMRSGIPCSLVRLPARGKYVVDTASVNAELSATLERLFSHSDALSEAETHAEARAGCCHDVSYKTINSVFLIFIFVLV